MDKLVANILEGSKKRDGEFLIVRQSNIIFPKETNSLFKEAANSLDSQRLASGYQIKKLIIKITFLYILNQTISIGVT